MSTKFQVKLRCDCGHRYVRTMEAADEAALETMPDPPCPKCSKAAVVRPPYPLADGKAPAVGGSLLARATDYTIEGTMQDYGMTDMRAPSEVREGESSAPKLAPAMQAQVDGFFGGPGKRRNPLGMNSAQILKAATAGRFMTPDTPNPVAIHAKAKDRPPINIVASDATLRRT
jgi:hypothetical protein